MIEQAFSSTRQDATRAPMGRRLLQTVAYATPALVLLGACAPAQTPDYTFTIAKCGDSGEVEIPQDKMIKLTVPGKDATVRTNANGSITLGDITAQTGGQYTIGDPVKDHMEVTVLGDTDSDGSPSVSVTSVCAVPMPPTPVGSE
ncbi:MAG: hypothetical protein NTZ55_01020 [Candidatus Roizmanbacteria bacterium]|nr:hypothetical protein [Candidatus Roizmanbacteria bacterium]